VNAASAFERRLALFVPLALLFGSLSAYVNREQWRGLLRPDPPQATIGLLPAAIDGAPPLRRWRNHAFVGTGIEEGAEYPGADANIQIDSFHNSYLIHNGIKCYVMKGERLLWEQQRSLNTAGGVPVVFDVALLDSGEGLRLVASTECSADGCAERRLSTDHFMVLFWQPASRRAVVPVSVMLSGAADNAAARARMLARLEAVAAQLDLAPARRWARLQEAGS
jgi:hypothetical protein